MEKLLISACLAGDLVRYDGVRVPVPDKRLSMLMDKGLLLKLCPEVMGGMPIPRPPAQISGGDGYDVLAGRAAVLDIDGRDVTRWFVSGAEYCLSICKEKKIRVALMKQKSPSCGSGMIYDGSFQSRLIKGVGVTTALLRKNGIKVFSENEIFEFKSIVNHNFKLNFI